MYLLPPAWLGPSRQSSPVLCLYFRPHPTRRLVSHHHMSCSSFRGNGSTCTWPRFAVGISRPRLVLVSIQDPQSGHWAQAEISSGYALQSGPTRGIASSLRPLRHSPLHPRCQSSFGLLQAYGGTSTSRSPSRGGISNSCLASHCSRVLRLRPASSYTLLSLSRACRLHPCPCTTSTSMVRTLP